MGTFRPDPDAFVIRKVDNKRAQVLGEEVYESFNPSLLGLGDITQPAVVTDAIAAVFDLEGFTNFCKQIEPHLSVPTFLGRFLEWIFDKLRAEMTHGMHKDGAILYGPLPFYVKFMGDGLLVLWDSSDLGDVVRQNIVLSARGITTSYVSEFLPDIRRIVVEPPALLRCGVARGNVFSVGNGEDYVGTAVNMASRLQRLDGISFAFNRRGFDIETSGVGTFFTKKIVIKRVAVRGIGDNELVALVKEEYEALSARDRKQFRDVDA